MAESEEEYLRQCREKSVCPECQRPLYEKVGGGQFKDGVFCSLDCYAKWHEALLVRRHQERLQKSKPNE